MNNLGITHLFELAASVNLCNFHATRNIVFVVLVFGDFDFKYVAARATWRQRSKYARPSIPHNDLPRSTAYITARYNIIYCT